MAVVAMDGLRKSKSRRNRRWMELSIWVPKSSNPLPSWSDFSQIPLLFALYLSSTLVVLSFEIDFRFAFSLSLVVNMMIDTFCRMGQLQ